MKPVSLVRHHVRPLLVGALLWLGAGAAALAAPASADIQRGEYLARLGDCVARHTAERGQPMAGGRALQTPFGTLYSTNITPTAPPALASTALPSSIAPCVRVAADGHNLYPAIPYPSYAKMTADDMQALYTYLMQGLQARQSGE